MTYVSVYFWYISLIKYGFINKQNLSRFVTLSQSGSSVWVRHGSAPLDGTSKLPWNFLATLVMRCFSRRECRTLRVIHGKHVVITWHLHCST